MRTDRCNRILVVCTRQIGDVLLTTPLIDAARQRWPDAQLDVLGFAGTLGMLRGNPQIAELIEVPAGSGWRRSLGLIRRLWRRYDLALVAQYSDRAHLYGAVAARRRSGQVPAQRHTAWWKRLLLAHAVEVGEERTHAVLEKLELLAPWAPPPAQVRVRPPAARELPAQVEQRLAGTFVVIHVPTLVRYKQWPIAHHIALVQGLLAEGHQVVLSGGPSAADRARTAEVVSGVGGAPGERLLDLAGALDLGQLVSLLRRAALYIGPDTSITHLAAACETPLLALYGPIDPRIFGPWPQGHAAVQPYVRRADRQQLHAITEGGGAGSPLVLLQGDPACVPCNQAGCDRHDDSRSECLETMAPQRVLAEARALLGGSTAPARATIPIAVVSAR
ncbi:MAG: glycosyltransferase family 9 protein [Rhizobacter sp.]